MVDLILLAMIPIFFAVLILGPEMSKEGRKIRRLGRMGQREMDMRCHNLRD